MRSPRNLTAIAAAGVALVVLLAGALAWLQPDRLAIAGLAAATALAMWAGAEWAVRRRPASAGELRLSVAAAALLLALPIALQLAEAAALIGEPDETTASRIIGVTMGLVLAAYGNFAPKRLPPLDPDRTGAECQPRVVRYSGWVFALAGLGYALLWLALPVAAAAFWSTIAVLGGMALVGLRIVRAKAGGSRLAR